MIELEPRRRNREEEFRLHMRAVRYLAVFGVVVTVMALAVWIPLVALAWRWWLR